MSKRILILISVLLLLQSGCVLAVTPSAASPASATDTSKVVVQAPANATATPTPFMPLPPTPTVPVTPTPIATATSTIAPYVWGSYPGPTRSSEVDIPPPMEPIEQPEGQTTILLMGSDQRPNEGGFRTDVMLLLTLNPQEGSVNVTSFPRDLYLYVPGWRMDRINITQSRGGFEMTSLTFEYNLGVKPDHWVLINFNGFVTLIDALGGINVQVGHALTDQRDSDTYSVPAGLVHMDGDTALWYVRSRYSTSDYDRTRRQQEVLLAIFYRLVSLDALARASELYEQYRQTVQTDLSLGDVLSLLPLAIRLANDGSINSYYIGPNQGTEYITPGSGAWVVLPDREAVRSVMMQALNAP